MQFLTYAEAGAVATRAKLIAHGAPLTVEA